MLQILVYFLIKITLATITVHSPDNYNYDFSNDQIVNYGKPSMTPIYGITKVIYLNECTYNEKVLENDALFIFFYNPYCNCVVSDLIESLYQTGSKFILIYNSTYSCEENYFRKALSINKYSDSDYDDFTIILTSRYWFSYYSVFSVTYKYDDYIKSDIPFVELILNGNRDQDKYIVKSLIKLIKDYNIGYENLKIQIGYSKLANSNYKDCIYHKYKFYCAYELTNSTGEFIIANLLASLTFYQSLPKNINSILYFLEHLLYMYEKCGDNYDINCNINEIIDSGGGNHTNEELLLTALLLDYPFSQIIINEMSFPWHKSFESGYCASFNNPPSRCPKCSKECLYDIQSLDKCYIECNTSSCGYSNLYCLISGEQNCYNFMLGDGYCNEMCFNESDCQNSNYFSNGNIVDNSKEIILLAVLVPCGVCWCGTSLILFIYICKRNRREKQEKNKSVQKQFKNAAKENCFKESTCILDLKEIEEHELSVLTPCNHLFHRECLKEWLENEVDNQEQICPVCKNSLVGFEF